MAKGYSYTGGTKVSGFQRTLPSRALPLVSHALYCAATANFKRACTGFEFERPIAGGGDHRRWFRRRQGNNVQAGVAAGKLREFGR